jgi:hypothetical protein
MCYNFVFENRAICEVMLCAAGLTTNDKYNTAHSYCMLDNKGYKHTLRIRNRPTYCSATTTVLHERTSMLRYTQVSCFVSASITLRNTV